MQQPECFISIHSCRLTNVQYKYKSLPMTGFKPRTSGIKSKHSTNWATTTARTQVLRPKSVNKRYRGRYTFISLYRTVSYQLGGNLIYKICKLVRPILCDKFKIGNVYLRQRRRGEYPWWRHRVGPPGLEGQLRCQGQCWPQRQRRGPVSEVSP